MLLTILIPTNTSQYLDRLIESFCNWNPKETELFISINGNNRLEVYNALNKTLSRLNNNNKVVLHVSNTSNLIDSLNDVFPLLNGEYVNFIGNDDFFITKIEELTLSAKNKGYDAISYPLKLVHFWPGTKSSDSLTIALKNKRSIDSFNPLSHIGKLHKNVGQDYRNLDLVNLYHGVVKKSRVEEIFNRTGRYVGGYSPDIYFAYYLSNTINSVLYIDYPLSISGIGLNSASDKSLNNLHQGSINTSPISSSKDINRWDPELPYFYTAETVWAASMMLAHEDLFKSKIIGFDYWFLKLIIYLNNDQYRKTINLDNAIKAFYPSRLFKLFLLFIKKVLSRLNRGFHNRKLFHGLTIDEIENATSVFLDDIIKPNSY